jgi:hypothetical protein
MYYYQQDINIFSYIYISFSNIFERTIVMTEVCNFDTLFPFLNKYFSAENFGCEGKIPVDKD